MAFQIKDFVSITAGMLNHMRSVSKKIFDFEPGSVSRTLVEGPAVEIEEFYLKMFAGLREAIPVATFLSFNFDLLPAAKARGFVSVSSSAPRSSPLTIPTGTIFSTNDNRNYASTADVIWQTGSTFVRIPVMAQVAGLVGNVAEGVIVNSTFFSTLVTINNSAITNGRDVETSTEREARFADYIKSLLRGTVDAIKYAISQVRILDTDGIITEYVARYGLSEEAGYVRVYVYSNAGVPSADLLTLGQKVIDGSKDATTGVITPGYRPAGVRVDVLPLAERSVPLSVRVSMLPGYTLSSAVIQTMADIFATTIISIKPGETVYLETMIEKLLAVVGVKQIVPVTSDNFICGVSEALTPGTFTSTAL